MWYKNNQIIYQGNTRVTKNERITINEEDHSLIIKNVQPDDEDEYKCEIFPEKLSMIAKLEVLTSPSAHIYSVDGRELSDRSITYRQGELIDVVCKGLGRPKSSIKWFTGGSRIDSNEKIQIEDGHLIIKSADRDNVRTYQCLADNGSEGGVPHASVSINIQCMLF